MIGFLEACILELQAHILLNVVLPITIEHEVMRAYPGRSAVADSEPRVERQRLPLLVRGRERRRHRRGRDHDPAL